MKRIGLLVMMCCLTFALAAQKKAPKWLEKQRKAVVTITTYGKENKTLHTGTGFFVTETGEVLTGYTLFKGAEKATVTDTDGNTYPVVSILGANDLYDVIRVKANVPKKVVYLTVANEPQAVGAALYMLPYAKGKSTAFSQGTITEVSTVTAPYGYYKTTIPFDSPQAMNVPVLTEDGLALGLMQDDAGGDKAISYAISAGYIRSLTLSSVDLLSKTYTDIGIRKAWPADPEQAQVALYLLSSSQDATTYLETLNDYIATFPNSLDAYLSRASHYAYRYTDLAEATAQPANSFLDLAKKDYEAALKLGTGEKNDILYAKAKVIFDVASHDTTFVDQGWSLTDAMKTLQEAIKLKDQPLYHQLEGDIYFTMGIYEQAYESYAQVNESEIASPSSFYWAAKAKEQIPGTNISDLIVLLDSAIVRTGPEPTNETLAYLLERIDYKMKLMMYDEAIADYNLYYDMLNGHVDDSFYYYRQQARFRGGDIAGALEDIQAALKMRPQEPNYLAEEASIYLRQEKYDESIRSLDKALALAPDFASCYRLKGVCLVRQNKKMEACPLFEKAKELGDPLAGRLIREHCQ
ncbi:trypsin-like peptidase domain-containing protein [Parabacteroides sp. PF5-6]|uniref:tetratricopeptide repeat protein n=1 Tax=Parabacteroides sp. PF5-6 TaxID=1742403 RepID=UPI00240633B8|nr:trypsin-like peptidase domain-containing protein [Parabacteroides sp. PF5-6]MDF9830737.1 tetratricopeptide (TPR) repeat protein [Parabacteroides sp. PF5-6]